jgi:signal peptidase I
MRSKLAPIGALALRGLCLVALGSVGWLLLATISIGVVTGWDRTVIISGSMQPALQVGDVVLEGDPGVHPPAVGSIVSFERHDGATVSHRVVEQTEDGRLRTRGDANVAADSDLLAVGDVHGVGRLVVPLVGTPQVWLADGRFLEVGLALLALVAAAVGAFGLRLEHEVGVGATTGPAEPRAARARRRSPVLRPVLAIAGLVLLILVAALPLRTAHGAFVRTSGSPSSSWGAAASFCAAAPSTLTAVADSHVRQNQATSSYGTQTNMTVRSRNGNRNRRALVRFTLPAVPARCQLESATLRLFATGSSSGRTVQVHAAGATWAETVTWNTQPGTTGVPATATSGAGWRTWTVTSQVQGQLTGVNRGFVLRDAAESASGTQTQTYSTREGANPPQLVLTWTAAP